MALILGIRGVAGDRGYDTRVKCIIWHPPDVKGNCENCHAEVKAIALPENSDPPHYYWPEKCPACGAKLQKP